MTSVSRKIACDLCVGGLHVVLNTAMMRYYGELDRRVRPLAFAVKYWAKSRGINDSSNGTLSSYGEWIPIAGMPSALSLIMYLYRVLLTRDILSAVSFRPDKVALQ